MRNEKKNLNNYHRILLYVKDFFEVLVFFASNCRISRT